MESIHKNKRYHTTGKIGTRSFSKKHVPVNEEALHISKMPFKMRICKYKTFPLDQIFGREEFTPLPPPRSIKLVSKASP